MLMWRIIYHTVPYHTGKAKRIFAVLSVGACHEGHLYFNLNIFCFRYSELTEVQQQLIRETLITWLQAQVCMSFTAVLHFRLLG